MNYADLYVKCYPGVKNELLMRANAERVNGRFVLDDQVVDGSLHSVAWIVFGPETPFVIIDSPTTTIVLYDMWDRPVHKYNKNTGGFIKPPSYGGTLGILVASVPCSHPEREDLYNMAFDVLRGTILVDVGPGANDYQDSVSLVSSAQLQDIGTRPEELTAKEFFAVAYSVWKSNPWKDTIGASLMAQTGSATSSELEKARSDALKMMNL